MTADAGGSLEEHPSTFNDRSSEGKYYEDICQSSSKIFADQIMFCLSLSYAFVCRYIDRYKKPSTYIHSIRHVEIQIIAVHKRFSKFQGQPRGSNTSIQMGHFAPIYRKDLVQTT
jgi:hypothetical protein